VRDWTGFVRERLALPDLAPEREARIVRELAMQLEDFYRDALSHGAGEVEADAHACRQIADWDRLTQDVWLADRGHARPRLDRLATALDRRAGQRGGSSMLANVLRDTRHAIRQLQGAPAFTVVVVLTLALGIGATSAIFSVVNGVLLRPLPYADPDALVRVHEVVPQYGRFAVAPATFLDWRLQSTVFERIAAYDTGSATYSEATGPERVASALVSWDLLRLMGVAPALGRGFTAEDGTPGAAQVIVLSHGMWQRRFGGDPGAIGRSITLSGTPATIVGVMPPGFYFPSREAEFWTPLAIDPSNASRGAHFLGVIARLKPGIARDAAASEMKVIAERLGRQYPESSAGESAEVVGLHDHVVGNVRRALVTLLAAVGVVVLIACANVANLLLVRSTLRGKEIAIRAALGAGRQRLIAQMLAESLLLALTGGALGVLFAYLAVRPIQVLGAGSIPRVADIAIDARVLVFAVVVSVATGLLFGLAPAWQASRAALADVLKDGGRSSGGGARGRWVRNGLLVAEVALSIVLLVGAALLLRSFYKLTSIDPGFRTDGVMAFRISLPRSAYPEDHQRMALFDRLLANMRGLPNVSSAGMVQALPLRGAYVLSFAAQGQPAARPGEEPSARYRVVSPGYFETLGIPLRRGRAFTANDRAKAPMVAVVDEAFVQRHLAGRDPIGRGLDIGNGTDGLYEIVGVVGNVRYDGLDADAAPTMYVPFEQDVFSTMWIVAKTPGDTAQLAAAVRRVVRDVDRTLPAYSVSTLGEVVSESLAERRFSLLLLGLFASMALFLAAVGLYGVMAYAVSQRTQEFGLRKALGAEAGDVLRMVVGGGLRLALVGVAFGIVGALVLSRLIEALLFEVAAADPASYAVTAIVLLVVAALACYVPARRAMRVDPVVALRQG
jgi:putative ABC transport system permease protein